MMHTYNPEAMSLQTIKVKGQIKVTPTFPNQCPYQVSTPYTLQF